MLSETEKKFSIIFSLILISELITGSHPDYEVLHYICKPAIVISLLVFFWIHSKRFNVKLRYLTVLALLFSLMGDILLMFVDRSPNYFLFGLVAFLVAHIMYISVFLLHRNTLIYPFRFSAILIVYGLGLYSFLQDGLNDMLFPVLIYMLVILIMVNTAFLRIKQTSSLSYNLVFIGAITFAISDSILALNKFNTPIAYSSLGIMLTYGLAQYLIVLGILKHRTT